MTTTTLCGCRPTLQLRIYDVWQKQQANCIGATSCVNCATAVLYLCNGPYQRCNSRVVPPQRLAETTISGGGSGPNSDGNGSPHVVEVSECCWCATYKRSGAIIDKEPGTCYNFRMIPQFIPDDRIAEMLELERVSRAKALIAVGADRRLNYLKWRERRETALGRRREEQKAWLDAYTKSLSPRLACISTGVSLAMYRRWRTTDPWFASRYNITLEAALEEVQSSVMARATGYLSADEDGNIITDAAGKPVYSGGSDRLAMALLGVKNDHDNREPVKVTINVVSKDTARLINGESEAEVING